ncbi:hypothetical protein HK099_004996 [Clydaea vesicula]|uniref:Uncharacterized protein n=1 Tax=Clydaea vesicula TaxID=447962 RepID=A0AAD5U2Z6_9FUNG|nr:hypothetical protein HK099_004996 [Clydaea vesicula]
MSLSSPINVEELLAELSNERSQPEYSGGAASYSSQYKDYNLELNEKFQGEGEDDEIWALSPNTWPHVYSELVSKVAISLVRLDDLRQHICQFTTKLRLDDGMNVTLAYEEEFANQRLEIKKKVLDNSLLDEVKAEHPDKTFLTGVKLNPLVEDSSRDIDASQLMNCINFPLMIESAKFPESIDETISLPNNLLPQNLLSETLQSKNLSPGIYRRWKRKITSKCSLNLTTFSFWYCLRQNWKRLTESSPQLILRNNVDMTKDEEEQFKFNLMCSISKCYVTLLKETSTGADKDDFFQSLNLFTEKLQKSLSESITELICGIKPYKNFKNWSMNKLIIESKELENQELEKQALDIIKSERQQEKPKIAKKIPSMVCGPNFLTQRILFDVYGNSPVVSHYLRNISGSKIERKRLTIHRKEVLKDYLEDENLVTYKSLVAESLKNSKKLLKKYTQREAEISRERNKIIMEQNLEARRNEKIYKRQLSLKPLTKDTLSEQLVSKKVTIVI